MIREIADIDRDEFAAMVEKRHSQREIAEHFNVSERTVANRMKKWGLRRWPGRYNFDMEELRRMYEDENMTSYEIADHLGVCQETINIRLRQVVKMRKRSARPGVVLSENSPMWTGGVDVTKEGYIRIRVNGEHKAQHRWIMEDIIGRPLRTDEHVHHIDLNRQNNVPSNLLLMTNSEHMRLHAALRKNPGLDHRAWLEWSRAAPHKRMHMRPVLSN